MAKKIYIDDLKVGQVVTCGYRTHFWSAKFQGFKLENGQPRALFVDTEDGMEWDAYLFHGKFCVGSSADPLLFK